MTEPLQHANLEIRQEQDADFAAYGEISIAFSVESVFAIVPQSKGLGGLALVERQVENPYVKDYDVDGSKPADWPKRFDTRHWMVLGAYADGRRVGGAAVAWKTPELTLIPYRENRAILWDLRIEPGMRSRGIGRQLVAAARAWANAQDCEEMVVETQNTNVPACRFYAAQGFELFAIKPFAYPELPEEVQLLWRLAFN